MSEDSNLYDVVAELLRRVRVLEQASRTQAAADKYPKINPDALLPPTATDDESIGYARLSIWEDTATGAVYVCTNATAGAAVWDQIN